MVNTKDTIAAISTPPGTGGIAVIRVSGPDAILGVTKIWKGTDLAKAQSHTVHLGTILDDDSQPLDQAVATIFRAPKSYTGDDTVELSIHGSQWLQRRVLQLLTAQNSPIRLAEPGEFTRRAFINGNIDLVQAEAVADMIAADSRAAGRIALSQLRGNLSLRIKDLREKLIKLASLLELELDFSEEDIEFVDRSQLLQMAQEALEIVSKMLQSFASGNAIKNGIPVAIVGPTNAGKSSLLNLLLDENRALVSDIHGTTRDIVEGTLEIGDFLLRLRDTAGIRQTKDPIEELGIDKSRQAAASASIVILVLDSTKPIKSQIENTFKDGLPLNHCPIIVLNKSDLPNPHTTDQPHIPLSCKTGEGLNLLIDKIKQTLNNDIANLDSGIITSLRHRDSLIEARNALVETISALQNPAIPSDLIAQSLRQVLPPLSSLTGEISTPQLLSSIFSSFCIGK